MGLTTREDLLGHPKVGASFEGFAIGEISARLGAQEDETFFWGVHTGAELDLLVVRGRERGGFEIKFTQSPRPTPSMRSAMSSLDLTSLDVVHAGPKTFPMAEGLRALSIRDVWTQLDPLR